MIQWIKKLIFAYRYKKAVKKANKLHQLVRMKYYVLMMNGKLKVVPKQNIRKMIRQKKFRKGVTVADIERMALYVTL